VNTVMRYGLWVMGDRYLGYGVVESPREMIKWSGQFNYLATQLLNHFFKQLLLKSHLQKHKRAH